VADDVRIGIEIRAVLMANLEEAVQSLGEDGWMFGDDEVEEE
jgi:hypothetical protein